jgi:hypothetical protein
LRVLLDECVPRRLAAAFVGVEVRTVVQLGWATTKNGALLRLAQQEFDVFVTTDQRLQHQQTIAGLDLAVVVLVARRNKLDFLLPLVPEVLNLLPELQPGEVRIVGRKL